MANSRRSHDSPRSRLANMVAPLHTVLLIIDMQNDFCAQDGYIARLLARDPRACREVAAPIMALVGAARAVGVATLWIKADYGSDDAPASYRAKQQELGIAAPCCARGTWGAEFCGVEPLDGEPVIEKHTFSAFHKTDLDQWLRQRNIQTLVFTGVQTNVCIESTLRDAFNRDYYVIVPRDCVASHTPDLHESTLRNVELVFGTVTTSHELRSLWSEAKTAHAARER